MKITAIKITWAFFKFLFLYLAFGYLSFGIIVFCDQFCFIANSGWNLEFFLKQFTELSATEFVESIRIRMLHDIPISEVADKMLDDSGLFLDLYLGFADGTRLEWSDFLPTIFPDFVKMCIANLVIFMFARIHSVTLKFFKGPSASFAIFLVSGWLSLAGFAVASMVLLIVDLYIIKEYRVLFYFLLALLCFLVHSVFLSKGRKITPTFVVVLKYLGGNLIKGVIFSILCWSLCFNLNGLYDFTKYGALFTSFVILCIVVTAINAIQNAIDKKKF